LRCQAALHNDYWCGAFGTAVRLFAVVPLLPDDGTLLLIISIELR
jgi:hypothetical protein